LHYKAIGVMSGTSLDGLDIAYCTFTEKNNNWSYRIEKAETIKYSTSWKKQLDNVGEKSALDLAKTNSDYGHYIGKEVYRFIKKYSLSPDFISSHGHTIFHQADKKITFQIGSGAAIAAECNLPVICDLRSMDVALGGQGAPLVPIGDHFLFSEYDYCLNLGGFANISYTHQKRRIAFDICPVNIVINELANQGGKEFDNKGSIAQKGKINTKLLKELNAIKFYHQEKSGPKSLGKEWVIKSFYPILSKYKISLSDKLRTITEHIALKIAEATNYKQTAKNRLLITGGGVYNDFLLERISAHIDHKIIIPDKKTIEFKEALIFAFLGVLRVSEEVNCLRSVTGALKNNVGGAIYWNNKGIK
jgi:anhydro-N-acetylmuramic acid kinase